MRRAMRSLKLKIERREGRIPKRRAVDFHGNFTAKHWPEWGRRRGGPRPQDTLGRGLRSNT